MISQHTVQELQHSRCVHTSSAAKGLADLEVGANVGTADAA
jgi:hypothetical protein